MNFPVYPVLLLARGDCRDVRGLCKVTLNTWRKRPRVTRTHREKGRNYLQTGSNRNSRWQHLLKHPQKRFLSTKSHPERARRWRKYQNERVGLFPDVYAGLRVVINVVAGDQASALQAKKDA